jgi:predicted aconitase with swiveling domain
MTGSEQVLATGTEVLFGAPAEGPALLLEEPLSFWGGVEPETGRIVDRNHPQEGASVRGTALIMGATRGSSSSSSTLLECVRLGTAPAVLLLTERDPLLVVGAATAWEVYGHGPAVVLLPRIPAVPAGARLRVRTDGTVLAGSEPPQE